MALRMDVKGASGTSSSIEDNRIPFSSGGNDDLSDECEQYMRSATNHIEDDDNDNPTVQIVQQVSLPESPRAGLSSLVRISQPDGSLRLYDRSLGRYVDQ